jgi:hypothetical protein
MSMKKLLVLVALGAAIAAPNFALAAPAAHGYARASNHGWSSRVHVYAPNHYAPWSDSYGNANMTPDRQLGDNEE